MNGDDNGKDNDVEVNDNVHKNVQEILEQLVAHFGQNIHAEVLVNSYSCNDTTVIPVSVSSSTTIGTKHKQREQQERSTPPILQLWLDRLLSIALQINNVPVSDLDLDTDRADSDVNMRYSRDNERFSENDNEGIIAVLCEWIRGYEGSVRPRVFGTATSSFVSNGMPIFDERCIPILKNYELVLSELLLKLMGSTEKENSTEPSTLTLVPTMPLSYLKGSLLRVINLLSTDVTLLTVSTSHRDDCNENKKNDELNYFRRNEGLPALLQILGNTLEALRQTIATPLLPKNDNDHQTNDVQFKNKFVPECHGCLRLCAVTLLAFDAVVGDSDNDNDCSYTNSAQSASAVLLPHNLSPLLSTSRDCRNKDLTSVRRILKHFENSTSGGSSDSFTIVRKYLEGALSADSLSYDDVDDDYWNSLLSTSRGSFSTIGWIDSNSNNARATSRIVQDIWRSMASLLTSLSKQEGQVKNNECREKTEDPVTIDGNDFKQHREQLMFVLNMLGGPGPLLRDVRAHFFGRNLQGMEDLAQRKGKYNDSDADDMEISSVVIHMGRRVIKTKKTTDVSPIDGPIYERVPSRTAAAVNTLRLLLVPAMIEGIDNTCRENVLKDVFPICAALLDSNNAAFGALGAAGFLRAIDVLAPRGIDPASTDVVPDQHALQKRSNIVDGSAWTTFAENTLTVLERSLQSSSDRGHVVVAIGRAQSRLFEIMLLRGKQNKCEERMQQMEEDRDNHFRRRRRIATEQWLLTLERSLYRPTTERQQLELLLGGVIPLLSQHALDEMFEADGMEVGRLGLAALLPLTTNTSARVDITEQFRGGNIGRKTQMASMVALVNLIFAAHPIMASHGGKIMSHLLMTAASITPSINRNKCERENENEEGSMEENSPTMDSIRNMAVLIAAIVLVICESKFVSQLLESIENDRGQYQQNLLTVVSEVREVAAGLRAIS
jgi:hypothetical protein